MDENFTIKPCETLIDFDNSQRYSKLPVTDRQKEKLNRLIHELPQAHAAHTLANAFVAKLPEGYSIKDMIQYKTGGYGTPIRGASSIEDHAALYRLSDQAAVLGIFTILSAATGQYFLSRIDNKLSLVNDKLDAVLSFLYGENRAELLAEVAFIKHAHENFSSIMLSDCQRVATISNLQSAQKIAVKDLEFYLTDLENIAQKNPGDFRSLCQNETKAWQALKCIELALQACVLSALMEVFYSENYDKTYVEYTHQTLIAYINRCNSVVLSAFSTIDGRLREYHAKPFENVEDRQRYRSYIKHTLAPYKNDQDSPLRMTLENTLRSLRSENTFYITESGDIYTKRQT